MEIQRIKLTALEPNTGQIPGLPTNPRQWTRQDVDRIARSLTETPELFEARPLLVYPVNSAETDERKRKYVILGGNLRYEGAKANKMKDVPCIVFPWATEFDTLKAIVIKDNGSFGAWDFDTLANEWGDLPLTDWGVPAWETEDQGGECAAAQEDNFNEDEAEIHVRCKPGDIWELGDHRLMCGDSIDLQQVKTLMGGGRS